METYSVNASTFFKDQKDPFANPVGYTISQGMEAIFDTLVRDEANKRALDFLDRIVRIRAVQDFTPSQAIGFLFSLKKVLREELQKELQENSMYEELLLLESRIDNMALVAFESYMKYREKVYGLKVKEFKNMAFRLLEKANLISDIADEEAAVIKNDTRAENMK